MLNKTIKCSPFHDFPRIITGKEKKIAVRVKESAKSENLNQSTVIIIILLQKFNGLKVFPTIEYFIHCVAYTTTIF